MPPPNKQILSLRVGIDLTVTMPDGTDWDAVLAAAFPATEMRGNVKARIRQQVTGQQWKLASNQDLGDSLGWHIHHFDGTDPDEADNA